MKKRFLFASLVLVAVLSLGAGFVHAQVPDGCADGDVNCNGSTNSSGVSNDYVAPSANSTSGTNTGTNVNTPATAAANTGTNVNTPTSGTNTGTNVNTPQPTTNTSNQTIPLLQNPLKATSITAVILSAANLAIFIGTILAVLAFIFIGFQFVIAQGDPKKLTDAKKWFLSAVIGTAILISAKVIVQVVESTLQSTGIVNQNLLQQ